MLDPLGMPGTLGLLMSWALAGLLLRYGGQHPLQRSLAIALLLEGMFVGTSPGIALYLPAVRPLLVYWGIAALAAYPAAYLAFVSHLEVPGVRRLATPTGQRILLALGLAASTTVVLWPHAYWNGAPTIAYDVATFMAAGALLFSLVVVLIARLRARPGTIARRRTNRYLVAFATRDALVLVFALALRPIWRANPTSAFWDWLVVFGFPFVTVLFIGLLTWAIVRTEVLGANPAVRRAVRVAVRTLAVITVFFAVGEGAERFFWQAGGPVVGLAASIVVAALLGPLQRLIEGRLARTPNPAKRERVYLHTAQGVAEDGNVSAFDRDLLDQLAGHLGLSPADQHRLDAQVSPPETSNLPSRTRRSTKD